MRFLFLNIHIYSTFRVIYLFNSITCGVLSVECDIIWSVHLGCLLVIVKDALISHDIHVIVIESIMVDTSWLMKQNVRRFVVTKHVRKRSELHDPMNKNVRPLFAVIMVEVDHRSFFRPRIKHRQVENVHHCHVWHFHTWFAYHSFHWRGDYQSYWFAVHLLSRLDNCRTIRKKCFIFLK